MAVSDDTIKAEGFRHLFKFIGKASAKAGKNLATNVVKNPRRVPELQAKTGAAAVSTNPKAGLSTVPDVITFYHTGKGFFFSETQYR